MIRELPLPRPGDTSSSLPDTALVDPEVLPGTLLELVVAKGDTLDSLFGKHNLRRGDLARIMALREASKDLAMLKPGDVIRVRHDAGTGARTAETEI